MQTVSQTPIPRKRDARLDVLRGLALATIFINHVPGTWWENWTSRNFGFSDAAEGFVFMSGVAAALAYSGAFGARPWWPGALRIWSRAWTLVLSHFAVTLFALGVSAAFALWLGVGKMLELNNIPPLIEDPARGWLGLVTMLHQLAYVNILPLYAVLLLATPPVLILARRQPTVVLSASIALWLAAGTFRWAMPSWPTPTIWFLNPFSWQLLFVLGLLTGLAAKQGQAFVPDRPWLRRLAWGVVIAILIWSQWDALGAVLNSHMFAFGDLPFVPKFLTQYDKTFLSGPRFLHFIALAYLLSTLGAVRRFSEAPIARPLAVMGRHGLAVFAIGSVLAYVGQGAKLWAEAHHMAGFTFDTLVIWGGLAILYGVAALRERIARKPGTPPQASPARAPVADFPVSRAAVVAGPRR